MKPATRWETVDIYMVAIMSMFGLVVALEATILFVPDFGGGYLPIIIWLPPLFYLLACVALLPAIGYLLYRKFRHHICLRPVQTRLLWTALCVMVLPPIVTYLPHLMC